MGVFSRVDWLPEGQNFWLFVALHRFHPLSISRDPGHVAWVLAQQICLRGCQALKFLVAARWLGPEAFALVAVAMTVLLVAEALSDTGLGPAMVQRDAPLTPQELGAVWSLQWVRGLCLAMVLWLARDPLAALFSLPQAAELIGLVACIPLVRNAVHPGYVLLQRERAFRSVSLVESSGALVDLTVTCGALKLGAGPVALVWGTLSSDLWRLLAGAWLARQPWQPNLQWHRIVALGQFGLWVWATSALAVLLNQFDKVVVARWLGGVEFGLYQTAARLAQLVVTDLPSAASQHAFANLSRAFHAHGVPGAQPLFWRYFGWTALAAGVLATLLAAAAGPLLNFVLGPAWLAAVPALQMQCLAMWVGALMAMAVAQVRAIGRPGWVVQAVLIQAVTLGALAWPAIQWRGGAGMAAAAAMAGALGLAFLMWRLQACQQGAKV
ncbi:hypothetical protein EYS42_10860 [Aquabacterium lacunae]|uniref:Polysaccharide biosynthesis protein n=1 Tax=Aquabacterium lacunae TaxID=2528630 RepID=A0A4Q9H454_9BURK|nr:hypothetical protein EYS42_10860 [Aquabacterium lacunae]